MIKKIVCLFLFSSLSVSAWELESKKVYLPDDLASVKGVVIPSKGVELNIKYKKFSKKDIIKPLKHKNTDTIQKYIEALLYSYLNTDLDYFETLVSRESRSSLDKKSIEQKKGLLGIYAKAINPRLLSVYAYSDGHVVSWVADNFVQPMQLYITKEDNNYKMSRFHASKDDEMFWNANSFIKYYPFTKSTPKLINSFKSIKKSEVKELKFSLNGKNSFINLFKEDGEVVSLVAIDNYDSPNYKFKDYDPQVKQITLRLGGKNFRKIGKHKIYYIESNYPLGNITPSLIKASQSFEIIRE